MRSRVPGADPCTQWGDHPEPGRGLRIVLAGACALTVGCTGRIGEVTGGGPPPPGGSPPRPPDGSGLCQGDITVGAAPVRRLSREQYDNTVRDLLGIDTRPADDIAPDEKSGPFRSNGVTPVGRLLVEQYAEVAEALAKGAVPRLDAIFPCDRTALGDAACASRFVERFGLRVYRRPLAAEERDRLQRLYAAFAPQDGYAGGLRLVIQTMLQSPSFLYHEEHGLPPARPGLPVELTPYQLASRLSYTLWNTMPDDRLLAAAGTAELATSEGLVAQAVRMLDDARSAQAMASFHLQWLAVDDIADLSKDPAVFPQFDPALRDAMREETVRFADHVVRRGDGRLETLLTAPFSFIEGPLFRLYGVAPPAGHDPGRPVPLDARQRAGLLTHASVLATHAHANQTSPVNRGVLVRRNIMCQPLPDPPPDVNNTPPAPDPNATTRERFAEHTRNSSCRSCHALIDGVGLGFERYDGVGAFRTTENGRAIDATGEIVSSQDIDGPFDGAIELAGKLARSAEVQDCMARQWFRFTFGRLESKADECSLRAASAAFQKSGYNVKALLLAIVASDAFRYRSGEGAGAGSPGGMP